MEKLGNLKLSRDNSQRPRVTAGVASNVKSSDPVHITRSPRLDPSENNPLNQTIDRIQRLINTLEVSQENIRDLNLEETQRTLEAIRPRIDRLVKDLEDLKMAGWSGPKGLGNPWAESFEDRLGRLLGD